MKLDNVKFKHSIKRPGGGTAGMQTETAQFGSDHYNIDYDPATGLVTVEKDGKRKSVHVSSVIEMEVAADQPIQTPPKPVNKFAPKNKAVA